MKCVLNFPTMGSMKRQHLPPGLQLTVHVPGDSPSTTSQNPFYLPVLTAKCRPPLVSPENIWIFNYFFSGCGLSEAVLRPPSMLSYSQFYSITHAVKGKQGGTRTLIPLMPRSMHCYYSLFQSQGGGWGSPHLPSSEDIHIFEIQGKKTVLPDPIFIQIFPGLFILIF